ncbi:hypothetical protein FIBSPDRAFT_1041014 [Athelia psychrophila]|uniref:Uncharacterized protein n=1 Tax=Athelia psychrophila TaxID=1759441 RepID=A0A166PAY7_9AGAM|nr:hypothetical protein FIBSPDRAFT_1041014 [Fibularhizoctonia sp. CBS 109695]
MAQHRQDVGGVLRSRGEVQADTQKKTGCASSAPPGACPPSSTTSAENDNQARDIKAPWFGHPCFLAELLAPPSLPESSSTSTFGSDVVLWFQATPAPASAAEHVVVLSHNDYDYTDTTTLQHIYAAQPKGSVQFFSKFGSAATPASSPSPPTPFAAQDKDYTVLRCPVFTEIRSRFGGFDLACIPIGAFSPRGALSPVGRGRHPQRGAVEEAHQDALVVLVGRGVFQASGDAKGGV